MNLDNFRVYFYPKTKSKATKFNHTSHYMFV